MTEISVTFELAKGFNHFEIAWGRELVRVEKGKTLVVTDSRLVAALDEQPAVQRATVKTNEGSA